MSGNSFGKIFKLTTFGESHGSCIGGIIEGVPAGFKIDFKFIYKQLARRRPGQSDIVSKRKEDDEVEFLSGIFENKTIGTPIGFVIKNKDYISDDYDHIKDSFRPSHADFTYYKKYGIRDYRGGGRSSARETACRVVAGSIAQQFLSQKGVSVKAYVSQIGKIKLQRNYDDLDLNNIDNSLVRCPDDYCSSEMIKHIKKIKQDGDTLGGQITGLALSVPVGLGEPVFDKLHADLGKAMLSVNSVKGFEYGFKDKDIVSSLGSEVNDIIINADGKTKSNHSGGIQGGISNGNDIYFRVKFKPVSTIMKDQESIDKNGKKVIIKGKGRHDVCVVPRAVPIVEAMTSIVLFDHYLRNKSCKIN